MYVICLCTLYTLVQSAPGEKETRSICNNNDSASGLCSQPSLACSLGLEFSLSRSYALQLHLCLQRCFSADAIGGLALRAYARTRVLALAFALLSSKLCRGIDVLSLSCCAPCTVCTHLRLCWLCGFLCVSLY